MNSNARPPKASLRSKLLLTVVATTVAFGIAELALLMFYREPLSIRFEQDVDELNRMGLKDLANVVQSDQELFWRLTPETRLPAGPGPFFGVVANRAGLREDHEIPLRETNVPRVLFLGDSCTYGYGLDHTDGFVEQVESRLKTADDKKVECINAGVPGYTLFQGWRFWETKGKAYRPQVVVACFGWNDAASWDGQSDFDHYRYGQACRPASWLRWSRSCRLITRMMARKPEGGARRPRLSPREFRNLLSKLFESVHDQQARLVLIVWPIRPQLEQPRMRSPWQEATYRFAADAGIPLVDLVPHFQELAKTHDPAKLYIDQGHATALANASIGKVVAQTVQPLLLRSAGKAKTSTDQGSDNP